VASRLALRVIAIFVWDKRDIHDIYISNANRFSIWRCIAAYRRPCLGHEKRLPKRKCQQTNTEKIRQYLSAEICIGGQMAVFFLDYDPMSHVLAVYSQQITMSDTAAFRN
jgi:hypothetical protein